MYRYAFILLFLAVLLAPIPSYASWLIYHKPEFHGRVIDAETREPIEGAVVVVSYFKGTVSIPEFRTSVIDVKETLTDKNGEFHIPSYATIIQPLSIEWSADFIVYKPGYGNYPNGHVSPPRVGVSPEVFFSREKTGTVGEIEWEGMGKKTNVTFGVVELPKLKTVEERRINISSISPSPDKFLEKKKNLLRLINIEEENLGLQKTDPFKAREFILEG